MTYAECVALYPDAPAVFCLQVSGDMGQSNVAPPVVSPVGWTLPSALQMEAYTNAQGYVFCLKSVFGKIELFALHIPKKELICFSSMSMAKKMFPSFSTPHQVVQPDYIVLPPNVPFGLLSLAILNQNKICRVVPGTNDIFEVVGYPPQFTYLNPVVDPDPVIYDPTIPPGSYSGAENSNNHTPKDPPAPGGSNPDDLIPDDVGNIIPEQNKTLIYLGLGLLTLSILK